MKRSKITEEITYILDSYAEELANPLLAELILATIENMGMLPPEISVTAIIDKEYALPYDLKVNKWEREDEKDD